MVYKVSKAQIKWSYFPTPTVVEHWSSGKPVHANFRVTAFKESTSIMLGEQQLFTKTDHQYYVSIVKLNAVHLTVKASISEVKSVTSLTDEGSLA